MHAERVFSVRPGTAPGREAIWPHGPGPVLLAAAILESELRIVGPKKQQGAIRQVLGIIG